MPIFTGHHNAALAAKEMCCQKIIVLASVHGGSLFVAFHSALCVIEQFFVNNCRYCLWNNDLAKLVLAYIFAVSQNSALSFMKLL